MAKIGKITPLAQYIIDQVRARRLEVGISGKRLSELIGPYGGDAIVYKIESVGTSLKYTTSTLKKAVKVLEMEIQDVLPKELLPDDTLQDKTKVPILKGMSAKAAINSLIEEGYLDVPRDRYEITSYCNNFYKEGEQKKPDDFAPALEDLYNKGQLIKIPADRSKGETRLKFQRPR